MRFIKTTQAQVDALRKKAKSLQRNGGGKHTGLLDRVARGAGYDHWHHVKLCLAETEGLHESRQLLPEIESIIKAALEGEAKIVRTGPEASTSQPFVLLATEDGDAWMLDPQEDKALCLVWHGVRQDFAVRDLPDRIEILWHGNFDLSGPFFTVQTEHPGVGSRFIAGYPVEEIREVLDAARSADRRIDQIFGQEDAVALTPEIIRQLVGRGWEEARLVEAARDDARYSPSRNTLLYPPVSGDVG